MKIHHKHFWALLDLQIFQGSLFYMKITELYRSTHRKIMRKFLIFTGFPLTRLKNLRAPICIRSPTSVCEWPLIEWNERISIQISRQGSMLALDWAKYGIFQFNIQKLSFVRICSHMVFLPFKFPANLDQLVGSKRHCLFVKLILQCNQACNTDHIRCYDRRWFILKVETAIFISMHPGKEKETRCLPGFFYCPLYLYSNCSTP